MSPHVTLTAGAVPAGPDTVRALPTTVFSLELAVLHDDCSVLLSLLHLWIRGVDCVSVLARCCSSTVHSTRRPPVSALVIWSNDYSRLRVISCSFSPASPSGSQNIVAEPLPVWFVPYTRWAYTESKEMKFATSQSVLSPPRHRLLAPHPSVPCV